MHARLLLLLTTTIAASTLATGCYDSGSSAEPIVRGADDDAGSATDDSGTDNADDSGTDNAATNDTGNGNGDTNNGDGDTNNGDGDTNNGDGDTNNGDGETNNGDCTPTAETCDGLDEDCDGEVDEDFADLGADCTVGMGACEGTGTYVCAADGNGVTCDATEGSSEDETCDGLDNDCDGEVDEDFVTLGEACSAGVGECEVAGALVCDDTGDGVHCDAAPAAPLEADEMTCDGLDNDCDGEVDEGCDDDQDGYCDDAFTVVGTPSACPSGGGDCDDADPQGSSSYPGATEVCDGRDNNCNGSVDEGATDAATYYVDCDADGYAAGTVGARDDCGAPPLSVAVTACGNTAGAKWTTTAPTDASRTDCYDGSASVKPGQGAWFSAETGGAGNFLARWDYDCNSVAEKRWTTTNVSSTFQDCPSGSNSPGFCIRATCNFDCPRQGWTSSTPPACGSSATYSYCGFSDSNCVGERKTETRTQECR